MHNTAFLLIKPDACTPEFVEYATNFLCQAGIQIDEIVNLSGAEVARNNWAERQHHVVHHYAGADSADLTRLIHDRDDVKSLFFSIYKELWDTVVAEGRILTAKDALVALGNITPNELCDIWWRHSGFQPPESLARIAHSPVKLFRGFYVNYVEEQDLYVVNGFYPALLEAMYREDSRTCRMTLSWPESLCTWQHFLTDIMGVADPSKAAAGSLRFAMYHQHDEFNIRHAPSLAYNGFDVSSGPLEALALRCTWTNSRLSEDVYGRYLLQEQLPYTFLQRLLTNPVVHENVQSGVVTTPAGAISSVFDILASKQSSEAARRLCDLYMRLQQSDGCMEQSLAPVTTFDIYHSDGPVRLTEGCEEEEKNQRNTAVLFVKPHAYRPAVFDTVIRVLTARIDGLVIENVVDVSAEQIATKSIIDRHYGTIARYAMELDPSQMYVPDIEQRTFAKVFGQQWTEALEAGRVWNARTALQLLGGLSPAELYALWDAEERRVRLTSGAYVCRLASKDGYVYIINGFYPHCRSMFTAADAMVKCYVVSWPERELTWKDFRQSIVGSTNPAQAPADSLRGLILEQWEELGLDHAPNTTENSIHASAGPLEAMVERHLWLGTPMDQDVMAESFRLRGLSCAMLFNWAGNPEVILGTSIGRRRAFDALENKQTSEVVRLARDAEQQELSAARESRLNRAVVLLHPPACTEKAIALMRTVLDRASICITEEGDRYVHAAADRVLGTTTMKGVARLANLGGEELFAVVSVEAKVAFVDQFKGVWEMMAERVHGAEVACGLFNLSPGELMKMWSLSEPVKLTRHCHAAYVKELGAYIINGFYPYLREQYTTPGNRVHYMAVEWRESEWTWEDFSAIVVGSEDISKAAAGSLQRTICEEWKTLGLSERPNFRAQCSVTASTGPLEAIADRVLWLSTNPALESEQRLYSDPLTQRLLAEGIPLATVAHYSAGYKAFQLPVTVQQERNLLAEVSLRQQTSECVRRLQAVAQHARRTAALNYAFVWVQPAFATEGLRDNLPELFSEHHVQVRSHGEISIEDAIARGLLNSQHTALYRNACTRTAAQVTISEAQKELFAETFRMEWQTAVQLSIVVNATEAVKRFGETRMIQWWEATPRKVCLSPSLYVAYMESEGVYVINGFFPYMRSRLHTGGKVFWFNVAWEADRMDWDSFLGHVIGSEDPTQAVEGSIRHHLVVSWRKYGFSGAPDSIECGLRVSGSPMEALAERCKWWNIAPEEDVLGRLLIQGGVNVDFLYDTMRNPAVHIAGQPVSSITELFSLLPSSTAELLSTLVRWQGSYTLSLLPDDTIITNPVASLLQSQTQEERLTEILSRAVRTATEYPFTYDVTVVSHNDSSAVADGDSSEKGEGQREFAVLAVHPAYTADGSIPSAPLFGLLRDHLTAHGVTIVSQASLRGAVAEERGVFETHFERLTRYSMRRSSAQTFTVGEDKGEALRTRFEEVFGDAFDPTRVLGALDVATDFNLPAKKVNAAWEACTAVERLAPDLFVGKVPTEDLYIINGFALHFREQYNVPSQSKTFFVVSWDSNKMDYSTFLSKVIGDSYVREAEPNSFHGILSRKWVSLGLKTAPHPYMGVVSASESALAAMRHRDVWLAVGLLNDPLGRRALADYNVSPYILRAALNNPCHMESKAGEESSNEKNHICLLDSMSGLAAEPTLAKLKELEDNYRQQPARNTAFLLIKPHALCRRFAHRLEHLLGKHKVRIEEEGDITGVAVHARGLLRYLYPAAAGYAVRDPATVQLTREEEKSVDKAFSATWVELTLGNMLINAYKALEVLGNITPQQLYKSWKVARRRVMVRPDLEITELEDYGLFVINGYFPALKQSFESPRTLHHWYVISWPEEEGKSWVQFLDDVIGNKDPQLAARGSLRGHLFRRWREYGMHSIPDWVHNGVHVSDGPLQGMTERLHFLRRDVIEDSLGELLLRKEIHPGLLNAWMANPDVCSRGVTAGVFEHLAGCDTSRLVRTLEALTTELYDIEAAREEAEARGEDSEEVFWGDEETPCPPDSSLASAENQACDGKEQADTEEDEDNVDNVHQQLLADGVAAAPSPPGEDPILFRNSAVLLVKPHIPGGLTGPACSLLRAILSEHGVRVVCESERESTPRLVDRLCFTEAYFGLCEKLSPVLREGKDISAEMQRRFGRTFGESWDEVTCHVSMPRLLSAGEAMQRLKCSAKQLYAKATAPDVQRLVINRKVDIVQLCEKDGTKRGAIYVVNGRYPYERQRMEMAKVAPGETNCVLGLFVVSWDGREMTWKDLCEKVIGDADPACSAEGSFRAQLLAQWEQLGLPARPDVIDNGVRCSASPVEALAERTAWFGTSDAIPDSLLRSACLADVDPGVLTNWSANPLVEYSRSNQCLSNTAEDDAEPEGRERESVGQKRIVTARVFDLLHHLNTRHIIDLAKHAEDNFIVISAAKDLQLPEELLGSTDPFKPKSSRVRSSAAARAAALGTKPQITSQADATLPKEVCEEAVAWEGGQGMTESLQIVSYSPDEGQVQQYQQKATPRDMVETTINVMPTNDSSNAKSSSKARQRLTDALVKDALLHARTQDDLQFIWSFYVSRETAAARAHMTPRECAAAKADAEDGDEEQLMTIDFRRFKRDFDSLETFGVPLSNYQLRNLFHTVEARGGRMCFDEFIQAMAAYQGM